VIGWFILLICAVSCTRTPAQTVQRETCLAEVQLEFDVRAEEECPLDQDWDTCPARPAIMADMKAAQEKCR
jgi:hypothetical protein